MSKVIIPPRMQINFISRCPLNCEFCAKSGENFIPNVYMDMREYRRVCNELLDFGIKEFELSPTIGEAFSDEHIHERVSYLAKNPKVEKIIIFTNLIDYKFVEEVLISPKVELNVSIYGKNSFEYESRTGVPLFNIFANNFERLIDYVFVTKKSKQICLYLRAKGIRRAKHDLTDQFYRSYFSAKLMKVAIWEASGDTNWKVMLNTKPGDIINPSRGGICKYALEDNCVFPGGDISVCGWFDTTKQSIIGNLYEEPLEEIYSLKSRFFNTLLEQNENIYTGICRYCTIDKVQPINTSITMEAIYGNYVSDNRKVQS